MPPDSTCKPGGQVPPQNIEAEASVLGAMLVAEPALERVIGEIRLERGDFYLEKHAVIFEAIRGLHGSGKPVDELSVAEALVQRNEIEEAGGRNYIAELAAKVPAAGNAGHYAEIVKRHGRSRDVIAAAQRTIEAAHSGAALNGEATQLAQLLSTSVHAGEIATVKGTDAQTASPALPGRNGDDPAPLDHCRLRHRRPG